MLILCRITDRAKLKGYYLQWTNAKYLLGCFVCIDILIPCSIFSKVMQNNKIDILGALTSLLKTLRETETLASKPLEQWPTYSLTFKRFTKEGDKVLYQFQEVKHFTQIKKNHYADVCKKVNDGIKSRLGWSDLTLMKDIIVILNTLGWEKLIQEKKSFA